MFVIIFFKVKVYLFSTKKNHNIIVLLLGVITSIVLCFFFLILSHLNSSFENNLSLCIKERNTSLHKMIRSIKDALYSWLDGLKMLCIQSHRKPHQISSIWTYLILNYRFNQTYIMHNKSFLTLLRNVVKNINCLN